MTIVVYFVVSVLLASDQFDRAHSSHPLVLRKRLISTAQSRCMYYDLQMRIGCGCVSCGFTRDKLSSSGGSMRGRAMASSVSSERSLGRVR